VHHIKVLVKIKGNIIHFCGGFRVPYVGNALEKVPTKSTSFETNHVKIAVQGLHIECRDGLEWASPL